MTDEQMSPVETIEILRNARLQRLLDRDIDAMIDGFYAPNVRLLPPDRPPLEGIEAVRAFWHQAPDRGLIDLELRSSGVEGAGDMLYETGAFRRTLRPRHGHPFKDLGKYLVVYRRQPDGQYRAEAEMFNSPRGR